MDVAPRVGDQIVRSLVLHRRTLSVLRQAKRGATAVVCALLLLLGEAERAQAELAAIVLQQALDELRVVEAEAAVHRRLGILIEVGQQIVQADGRRLELVGRLAALLQDVETGAERRADRLERARHPGVAEHRLQRLDLLAAAALERLHHHRAEVGVVHHLARLRHLLGVGERLHRLRHLLRVLQLRRDLVDVERRLHAVAAAAEAAPLLELVGAAEEHCGVDEVLDGRNCAIPAAAQFLRLGGAAVELVQLQQRVTGTVACVKLQAERAGARERHERRQRHQRGAIEHVLRHRDLAQIDRPLRATPRVAGGSTARNSMESDDDVALLAADALDGAAAKLSDRRARQATRSTTKAAARRTT